MAVVLATDTMDKFVHTVTTVVDMEHFQLNKEIARVMKDIMA